MFEARLAKASTLKHIFEGFKDLLVDVIIDCNADGIFMQAMDSSHVALVSLRLNKAAFESFRCDRTIAMGVHLESVMKIMKCVNSNDTLTIRAQDDGNFLTFVVSGKKDETGFEYDLHLMNIEQERLVIPDSSYECGLKMTSSDLTRIIRSLSNFGETVLIKCNQKEMTFSSTGDIGKGCAKVSKADQNVTLIVTDLLSLPFATKFLQLFCKASGVGKMVTVSMSEKEPLMMEFPIDLDDNENNAGYIRYYLAPKVQDDGEKL